jgi:hypothetical protein
MREIIGAKIIGELRARIDKKAEKNARLTLIVMSYTVTNYIWILYAIIENAICKAAEIAANFLVRF